MPSLRLWDGQSPIGRLFEAIGYGLKANEKNIDIFIANVSDGNVGTGSADIFSSQVLVGAFHKCELQSMSHGNEVYRGVFG